MRKLIVHCGLNKTGTSSLQWFLSNHEYSNYRYIKSGRDQKYGTAHHPFALGLKHGSVDESVILEVNNSDSDVLILSSERFFEVKGDKWQTLRRLLASDIEIIPILYLRDPVSYRISWYQQNVQMGNIMSLEQFIKSTNSDFASITDTLGNIDGDFLCRLYERDRLKGGNIIEDFFHAIGLDLDFTEIEINKVQNNPSVNGHSFELLRALCQLDYLDSDQVQKCRKAIEICAKLRGDIGSIVLSESEFRLIEKAEKENRDFFSRYFSVARPPRDFFKIGAELDSQWHLDLLRLLNVSQIENVKDTAKACKYALDAVFGQNAEA